MQWLDDDDPAVKVARAANRAAENTNSIDPDTDVGELEIHNAGYIRMTPILPRGWLLGRTFCRKFLSALVGSGGDGKTGVRYAQYIAVATGRQLTGEHIYYRSRVLIVCLEDNLDEVRRRIDAVLRHHGIDPAMIDGWLFYCTPEDSRFY